MTKLKGTELKCKVPFEKSGRQCDDVRILETFAYRTGLGMEAKRKALFTALGEGGRIFDF